jgi:hypothetical protein
MKDPDETEWGRIRRERDLYRRLLDMGGQDELEILLRGALDLRSHAASSLKRWSRARRSWRSG